tara:strand:- start:4 stop:477 length:474 start_codon:yes stop_codon:yes gene_type:complete
MEIAVIIAALNKALKILVDSKKTLSLISNLFSVTRSSPSVTKPQKTKLSKQQTDFKRVAEAAIRAKNEKIQRQNELNRLDDVHGLGTSRLIIEAEEAEELAQQKKQQQIKLKKERQAELKAKILYWTIECAKLLGVIALSGGAGYVIWINRCTDGAC